MNKKIKVLIATIMSISFLLPYSSVARAEVYSQSASENIKYETNFDPRIENALRKLKVTTVDAKFQDSQVNPKFPEDNPTSRIYAQGRRVFKAYAGRGNIIVENHGATSAEVYVNGKLIDINEALKTPDGKTSIDIGKYTVNGDNALKVLNVSPAKTYIDVKVSYPELAYGLPQQVGFSIEKLNSVDKLINKEVENGFPGAVLLVIKDGVIIKNTAYGYKKLYDGDSLLENPEAMTTDTLFDLASNTKIFATNLALQKLVSEGKLNINDLVCKYIPEFTGEGRESIKIKDLMTHSAGFDASIKFYDPNFKPEGFYSVDRATTLKLLEKAPLVYPTGSKTLYSDTDYMILGYVLENITGQREDEYVENNIYKPLGLANTMFNPLQKGLTKADCAATERNGNTRDHSVTFPGVREYTLQGEVHDEKAYYSMGGVSGHAGLFSTTHDLAVLAQTVLNGGGYGGVKLFSQDTMDLFAAPSQINSGYGLGWNRQIGSGDNIYEFGPYADTKTIGHTGWTGTDVCIDPDNDMAVILLTNKKNTPCPKGVFKGDSYETGKYGSIISLVYEALLEK